ncbi:MAG TPA: SDR family oxidoreductase [Acidimicrobiia bacterium]|nr:SDR family oxidoreductase [Acidimicrobiia bacterium]
MTTSARVRTYAVTGSASGLGAATSARLVGAGARVIGVDLRDADVDADLATTAGRADAVARVLDACDGVLDGVVPCAGLGPQVADHALMLSVNYFGAVAFLDGLAEALGRGDQPAVVMISSHSVMLDPTVDAALVDACTSGDEGAARARATELPGNSVYASAKAALARTTRRRAAQLGPRGIRVNAVAPGAFDSPLLQGGLDDPDLRPLIESIPIPLGRRGTPDDIAAVVTWLLSDDARYVTGSLLVIDGGTDALLFPDRVP